jgi:ComF family protein
MQKSLATRWIKRGLLRMQAALMPDLCCLCRVAVKASGFCPRCLLLLQAERHACARCALPLAAEQAEGIECGRCRRDPPPFHRVVAALPYRFPIDTALKALKFDARLHIAPALASLLQPLLKTHFSDADALVPVPLHWLRHASRGFNQATEICTPLARASGLPMPRVAQRVRSTPSQSGLDAVARRKNLRNAFEIRGRLACRHPVVVDDVMTTGETCRQLAHVLLDAGAESVGVLVVARA